MTEATQDKRWVVKRKDDGTIWYATPIQQHVLWKFFGGVEHEISLAKLFWAKDLSPESIWKVAQEKFKEVDTEYPGFLTEHDLEYYHPTNKR